MNGRQQKCKGKGSVQSVQCGGRREACVVAVLGVGEAGGAGVQCRRDVRRVPLLPRLILMFSLTIFFIFTLLPGTLPC